MLIKRIIVACGSGVATSNVAAEKLRNLLREQGYHNVEVRAVDIKSLEAEAKVADLLVSITPYSLRDKELSIPSINGIPLLTGIGVAEVIQQIKEILKL
ncbi:MAG: PTS sugar transporter subunit IIB [Anaerolineae bacterium]|nr:PTS sugar transporter subunit IIB [Anaerolineae bacterium]